MLSLLIHHLVYLVKVLLEKLLLFGFENSLQNLIYFLEVTHLDHSICLVNYQIFQMFKIYYFLPQEFVQSTRSSDDDLRFPLPEDPQLLFLRHSSYYACDL